jgi:hypothetical protein
MSNTATAEKKNGNGKGDVKDLKNNNTKLSVIPGGETEKKEQTSTTPAPKVFTVEQKKERIFKLQLMSEKHDALKEEMKKLEEFQISHDSEKCKLSIQDDKGKTFSSNNPDAIKTMIDICKNSIILKIAAVEAEIEF